MPVASRPRGARWTRLANQVAERDRWRCVRCKRRVYRHPGGGSFPDSVHVDHIVPISRGGDPWNPNNLQTLCRDHNLAKGDRIVDYRAGARLRRLGIVAGIGWIILMIMGPYLWPGP